MLTDIAIIVLAALLGNLIFNKMGLPGILAIVMEGKMTSMTAESGQVILAIAVLSIVVTAPLGAIGIKAAGPHLLKRE